VFHTLVTESVVSADVKATARAGLDALVREGIELDSSSVFVGSDVQASADVLEAAVAAALASDPRAGTASSPVWAAVNAMAASLGDPHATLFAGHAFQALGQTIVGGGSVVAPGFSVHRSKDGFVVSDVFALGPAQRADLRVGDAVITIAGRPLRRGQLDLLGWFGVPEHTPLPLVIERPGHDGPIEICLDLVSHRLVNSVCRVLQPGVGYVRIRQMTMCDDPTVDARDIVAQASKGFDAVGLPALVLDLRSNSGGLGVSKVVSLFTDSDPVIWYRYLDGREEPGKRKGAPWPRRRALAILVNEQTHSAAEMVALALSDLRAATVIGQPTGGALTLPRYLSMRDGHALGFSEALALGPVSRRCPDGRRVQPHRVVPNPSAEDLVAGRDSQLDAALEVLAGAVNR
jgi:carboxyl-terminal processing protease